MRGAHKPKLAGPITLGGTPPCVLGRPIASFGAPQPHYAAAAARVAIAGDGRRYRPQVPGLCPEVGTRRGRTRQSAGSLVLDFATTSHSRCETRLRRSAAAMRTRAVAPLRIVRSHTSHVHGRVSRTWISVEYGRALGSSRIRATLTASEAGRVDIARLTDAELRAIVTRALLSCCDTCRALLREQLEREERCVRGDEGDE